LTLGDLAACAAPIGLFLGRLANFVNGELFGRVSDVPWAMVFPAGGPAPRHPSQLYEAALEGALLFVLLLALARGTAALTRPGLCFGVFLTGYGLARILVELFREPDAYLGFILAGISMGQILSVPLVVAGLWLIWRAERTP
ncbi:MAG: prolipoprotein diacylglyceryl transferase, partial [Alphaproteobacteria bacterium]